MTANTIFDHVKILFDYELYAECMKLASLLLSAYDQVRSILTGTEHYMTLMYYAESLFYERRFRYAESVYRQAMLSKKSIGKSKLTTFSDTFPDATIRYRIAQCLFEMRRIDEAITMIQSIPIKQRTPKINLFLGKLALYVNNERSSIAAFKEVLKECPLAIESMEKLFEMGVKGVEVNSLVLDVIHIPQCSEWLSTWIIAQDSIYCKKYTQAIQTLRSIESNSIVRNSNMLLSLIGEVYYINGDYDNALTYLKRSYSLYSIHSYSIQIYAKILAKKKKLNELERLIPSTSSTSEYTSEMWYIMAQYLFSTKKLEKSAYFAQKALFINARNVEAILLKCRVYIAVKKSKEALMLLRIVQQVVPHRYEVYKLLISVYMGLYRLRDAQSVANLAMKTIGQTPRTLVLSALTYNADAQQKQKEKPLLQKALEMNEHYLPAVTMLAEYLQLEGNTTEAVNLLRKQVAAQPNCTLHSMLGDFLQKTKDQNGALENYTVALNLDPSDRHARAGFMAIDRATSSTTLDNSFATSTAEESTDMPSDFQDLVELVPPSDPDPESESDAMWSDVEIEVNNG